MPSIEGQKGGSASTHTPVESPDSLQSTSYAKMLFALGEGEWLGDLDGTKIQLDGTPIQSADGTINFPGVQWEFRSGTPDQSYIAGMPDVENETAVALELTNQTPWIRAVTNTELSAVRLRFSWSSLQQQKSNGDVVGYRIQYAVDVATDGGAYQEVLNTAVDGKTTTTYERSHRIDLPAATTGWQIRVRRLTANSSSNLIADTMVIEAITEVIDAKLRYPETALLFIQFDASQFQNIPVVSSEPKMRIIRVPTTYDPVARTYSGTWDGTFKWAWSNNPAWVAYDILMAERFGLGERITAANLYYTKWDLYTIAQYCDQLVPDGRGGGATEPRFLCDVYIQSQEEAWTVLNDLVAVFRGMMFWANNQMNVLADMPRDMDYAITRANVKDGKFTYASASEKTHYSTAMVSWSDPANGYQDAVQPVFKKALIRRYGIKQADITAIGCIRQTESIRRGDWVLETNDKDRVVSFTVGLDGKIPLPGYIIGIADEMLAGRPLGGRISAAAGRNITLDRVSSAAVGERLIINLPSGKSEGRTISSVSGKVVTVTTGYSETPEPECVWAVDATNLALQLFRVTGITAGDDGVSFDITAIEYDPNKFARIDTGARIEDRPVTVIPPGVQPPPSNVVISSFTAIAQGLAVTTMRVTWDKADSAIAYESEWRKDNGNWITGPRTSAQGFEVTGIYAGRYQARVRAINASEISSVWANALETQLNGKEGNPPALASFTATGQVFGIALSWQFPAGAEDTQKTEIWINTQGSDDGSSLLGDYAYPQNSHTMTGLAAGKSFWFKGRLVDKTGNQGPWTNWINGASSSDASEILDYLKGQITDTQLGQDLLAPIQDARELKNMWSVKVGATQDGKQYLAGIGVGVENTPSGMQSQVLILADRFAVLNQTNGVTSVPFAIDGGQVFMNIAFIKDGTITNAKIGDYIQSNNWVAGQSGWHIGKDGSSEFNDVTVRGTVYATDGLFKGRIEATDGYFNGTVYANHLEGDLAVMTSMDINVSTPSGSSSHEGNYTKTLNPDNYIDRTLSVIFPLNAWASTSPQGGDGNAYIELKAEIFVDGVSVITFKTNANALGGGNTDYNGTSGAWTVDVPQGQAKTMSLKVTKTTGGGGTHDAYAGPAIFIACRKRNNSWS
ncbi:phage tail protein [Sodalis sp. RH20]|uniref:phage tail protein n=1 Tax=unclassified Sodalis (in: enterobacteria) TaxID=2636512 RepID=UPI0039B3F0A2